MRREVSSHGFARQTHLYRQFPLPALTGAAYGRRHPIPPFFFFTLRLWPEKGEDGEPVWRGRVQHTASGEVRFFQGWQALVERVLELMEVVEEVNGEQ